MSLMQYGALFIPVMTGLPCICCSHVPLVSTSIAWEKGKTGMEDTDIGDPMNYRAKLANASCRTARSGLAVSGKIILAGGSGIFPENLAFPEAFTARPP